MAQKINPLSFRLGQFQVWKSFIQFYGKSFNQYTFIFHKYFQIQYLLIKLFLKSGLILDYQESKISKNRVFFNLYYFKTPRSKKIIDKTFFQKISKIIKRWFWMEAIIYFYFKPKVKSTTSLIIFFTKHLLVQNITTKRILWSLCKLLEIHLNSKKISSFKNGFMEVSLKGFRICLSGRIDGSKNQMAKSMEQSIGSLSLNSIHNYIEYKSERIYTKSGLCGLQIWLFYEII